MNNIHLIPANVVDIVEKLATAKGAERMHLIQRLETIREYCDKSIQRFDDKRNIFRKTR